MSRRRFLVDQFAEFLTGGHVEITHSAQIPIWAGFLIEQNARILEILEYFMPDIETQLKADIASLVDSNTQLVAFETQQVAQITDLQGQVASLKGQIAAGQTPSADTLAALDSITQQIAATAAAAHATASASATNPAPATPVVEPQQPIVATPTDSGSTSTGTTDTGVPVQQPITAPPADATTPATTDTTVATDSGAASTGTDASSTVGLGQ